jgi:hypothetical protein
MWLLVTDQACSCLHSSRIARQSIGKWFDKVRKSYAFAGLAECLYGHP